MSTRTRTRYEMKYTASVANIKYWLAQNRDRCLPFWSIDSSQSTTPLRYGTSESISDRIEAGYGFKPVSHTKVQLGEPKPVRSVTNPSNTTEAATDVSYTKWCFFPAVEEFSCYPYLRAEQLCAGVPNSDSVPSIVGSPDRLGEIPSRLLGALSSLQLGVTAYETREFPALLRQLGMNKRAWQAVRSGNLNSHLFQSYVNALKSGKKAMAKLLYREMTDKYLMYKFGILPTVNDCKSITSEIKRGLTFRKNVRAAIRSRTTVPKISRFASENGGLEYSASREASLTQVWGGNLVVNKEYSDPNGFFAKTDDFLTRYVGPNGMSTIWECMPLSFVLDWFFSIDQLLDRWFLQDNATYVATYWSSTKAESTTVYTAEYWTDPVSGPPLVEPFPADWQKRYSMTKKTVANKNTATQYDRVLRTAPSVLSLPSTLRRLNLEKGLITAILGIGTLGRLRSK